MKVYAIRREDGKWFKSRKCGWHDWDRGQWVDLIDDAKIFTKEGQAKSSVTWVANNSTPKEVPELVEFELVMSAIIDQKDRVAKAKKDKERRELEYQKAHIQRDLEFARKEYDRVKENLRKLEQKV
jgi:hypothetical protein